MNGLLRFLAVGLLATTVISPVLAATSSKKPRAGITASTGSAMPVVPSTGQAKAVPYGSYCFTPLGRIGPGAVAPLGSPCTGNSSQGSIAGQTVE